jgi:hypothetical protein
MPLPEPRITIVLSSAFLSTLPGTPTSPMSMLPIQAFGRKPSCSVIGPDSVTARTVPLTARASTNSVPLKSAGEGGSAQTH